MPERVAYIIAQHFVVPRLGEKSMDRAAVDGIDNRIEAGIAGVRNTQAPIGRNITRLARCRGLRLVYIYSGMDHYSAGEALNVY
jgi:hypothetical protein